MSHPPVPYFFRDNLPPVVAQMDPVGTPAEVAEADRIRKQFFLPDTPGAYMVDIVRAFRPLAGAQVYIEVGSRDKGNIAWLQHRLGENPLIIDVDYEQLPEAMRRLRANLRSDATYVPVEGDSVSEASLAKVREALGGRLADAIFLDSSHMYDHVLREIDLYFPLLRPGGLLLIHDIFWEGSQNDKGKSQAMVAVDRLLPVYAIHTTEPVRRYFPVSSKGDTWGGVGIIIHP